MRKARKRPRSEAAGPPARCAELEELTRAVREWTHSLPAVPTFSLCAARAAVAEVIDSGAVSYDVSLNGWWHWFADAKSCAASGSLAALRQRVLDAASDSASASALGLQLCRLPAPTESTYDAGSRRLLSLLADLRPHAAADIAIARHAAAALADQVEHDDGHAAAFDFRWLDAVSGELNVEATGRGKKGFALLIQRLCDCAKLGTQAVSLSTRVRAGTALHRACEAVAAAHGMSAACMGACICPAPRWTFGPPARPADVASSADPFTRAARLPCGADPRFYLILGAPSGLTPSHWDRGVQAVLYHTVAGVNHVLALPRRVALMAQAVMDGAGRGASASSWARGSVASVASRACAERCGQRAWHVPEAQKRPRQRARVGRGGAGRAPLAQALEREVLSTCAAAGALEAGTFGTGATMLIAPGGGHAVMTGAEGKVVVAGEWHLCDGAAAADTIGARDDGTSAEPDPELEPAAG